MRGSDARSLSSNESRDRFCGERIFGSFLCREGMMSKDSSRGSYDSAVLQPFGFRELSRYKNLRIIEPV